MLLKNLFFTKGFYRVFYAGFTKKVVFLQKQKPYNLISFMELFNEWSGLVITTLSLMGGAFVFFRHDRKLKKQECLLNEYQIGKNQQEIDLQRQANVICQKSQLSGGYAIIRFINTGLVEARNIRIEIINKDSLKGVGFLQEWGPYEQIDSHNGVREERLELHEGSPEELQILIVWDDDFGKNRGNSQTLQL